MIFYICHIKMPEGGSFLLWHEGDPDGVLCNDAGEIITFASLSGLKAFSEAEDLNLSSNKPAKYDFSTLLKWALHPQIDSVDCENFLNAWNLFTDIVCSSPKQSEAFLALDKSSGNIYEKLFWGSNLPAVTPPGKEYVPIWSSEEVETLGEVFKEGIAMFSKKLPANRITKVDEK